MPHVPNIQTSPKKLQPNKSKERMQTPSNTSSIKHLIEELNAIKKQINECVAYMAYHESKRPKFEKYRREIEMLTDRVRNLKPSPPDTPISAQTKAEKVKQIIEKCKILLHYLQSKGNDSQNKSNQKPISQQYPIRPLTRGPNVDRGGTKPKATSACKPRPSRQRRTKENYLTKRERKKRERLNHTCSYCNRIHPLDPDDYDRERYAKAQMDIFDVEVPETSSNIISDLEFPYLDQHLEDCKCEKEDNENQTDESSLDMGKSVVEVSDDETLSCGNSEVENGVLDIEDDDVTVSAQSSEENPDDSPTNMLELEPKKLVTDESVCSKHAMDLPEWIDYCPFCDYDSLEHAGTVVPDFCKIRRGQTTCEYSPSQLLKKTVTKHSLMPSVNKAAKQKTGSDYATTPRNANDKMIRNNRKEECSHTKSGNERTSLATNMTEDKVNKMIKSLRKSLVHAEQ